MKHTVTHGGESAQVTDHFSYLKSDVRTEHLQRVLTRVIDRFLAEEGIENKGPGSRIVVRRAFESEAFSIRVDMLAGYVPPCNPPQKHHHKDGPVMLFKDLQVGDRFYSGSSAGGPVNMKITTIWSGSPPYSGIVNNVDTESGVVSGCGPEFQVYRIQEEVCAD